MSEKLMSAVPAPSGKLALLLLGYPALAIAGAVMHRPALSLAALLLLLTVWLAPSLLAGRASAWLGWFACALAVAVLASLGLANALLDAVPVIAVAAIAIWFGGSLRAGREPRVATFIRVLEGPEHLAQPRVAHYARAVTVFWTVLLGVQALLLAALLEMGLVEAGLPGWVLAYQHLGGYLLIPLAFGLEYLFRRWHLRHLSHPDLHTQALQMMRCWPQLLRGGDGAR